ncbi:MAG: toll/interleukin-1 receptor domain-containing protein [SAR202 cluster bacterium]|nr:toll/interleukin-1 receptor domain-containing protein [SAR202 cluster bacterium]
MLPNEVFLSHSSQDRPIATSIAETLRRHGIATWFSETDILGAQQWHDEIGAALQRCDWFALILSPNFVNSIWVKRELLFALQQNRFVDKIVPILNVPCEFLRLSWTLPIFQMIDFTREFDSGCQDLLRTWGRGYRNPQS